MTRAAPPPPEWLRTEARELYGRDPITYEAGRPDYPERVYEVLVERCGLRDGARVLEIGPGTGRVTRRLVTAGAHVVAIEPDAVLATTVKGPAVDVVQATFEAADLPSGAFDLIVAAMSFHWVDQQTGLPKLARVLRPGGSVAIWWTVFGDPIREDPFDDAIQHLVGEGVSASEDQFELAVDARIADLEEVAGLIDAQVEVIRWTARMTSQEARAFYASLIRVIRLPDADREQALDQIVEIADARFGGVIERPFVTALYTARRPEDV